MFRSMRFGVGEAHGRGTADAVELAAREGRGHAGRRRQVHASTSRSPRRACAILATELLTIEATGDYARAKTLLDKYGKETPEMQRSTRR